MLTISSARYFLYNRVTDLRKSFDGLCGIVTGRLGADPRNGDVFIFINKGRNRAKLLRWEPGGFILVIKRLERGRFESPAGGAGPESVELDYAELAMLINGFSLKNTRKRLRFS